MDTLEDVVKEDSAAEEATFEVIGGGELAGLQPVGHGGVDLGIQGSAGLAGADLLPQGLRRRRGEGPPRFLSTSRTRLLPPPMMDGGGEDVRGGDPAAKAAATFEVEASSGELAGLQPFGIGQDDGVDFGVQVSAVLGRGADLRPQELVGGSAGGGYDHAVGAPQGPLGGGGGELGSPDQPQRSLLLLGREDDVVADDAGPRAPVLAAGGGRGLEQDPAVGGAMRSAALLAMFVAAMRLIGEHDTSRRGQFRTLMYWLGGCIGLFRWILSRR